MVKLLSENKDKVMLKLDDLVDLKDSGIPGAVQAMRELDPDHLFTLILSDPKRWPVVLVTKSDRGYLLLDGGHRKEAARSKKLLEIEAEVRAFKSEDDVVEAVFQANLRHGLKANDENRSNYARWLHQKHPAMSEQEIAEKVGVSQPTVSKALRRQPAGLATLKPEGKEPTVVLTDEERKEHLRKTCKSLAALAVHFADESSNMDARDVILAITEVIRNEEERSKVVRIVHFLEESLEPQKARRRIH